MLLRQAVCVAAGQNLQDIGYLPGHLPHRQTEHMAAGGEEGGALRDYHRKIPLVQQRGTHQRRDGA